jgi:xanthine dehydrogenase YagR molybdenum-binding subunit
MSQETIRWNDPKTTRYLNKRFPRVDGPEKVTGAAKYTYDVVLPNMLYAKVLRSPYAHARVVGIDASEAERMPGVVAVITDLSRRIQFAGQEVAAVAAETEEVARDALRKIRVNYEPMPHAVNLRSAMKESERVGEARVLSRGEDPDRFWASASAVVEGEYYVPVREHLCLETHGVVFRWDSENQCTVWVSTQAVHGVAGEIAGAFGIPRQNVTVICEYMGGGFGSKFSGGTEALIAGRFARMTKRPVKLMLERHEEQLATGNGPDALMRCKAAMAEDGRLIALSADLWGTSGPTTNWSIPFPYIYRVPNYRLRFYGVNVNACPARALRAPGHPQANFLMETVVDELCAKLGLDPVRVRQINQDSEVRSRQLQLGAERIGWHRRNKTPGEGSGRYRRGIGCACTTWGGGGNRGSVAEIRIGNDGSVWVGIGTQDLGTGTRTLVAGIVAEDLGLPLSRVKAEIGRSTLGQAGASGGSTTAASVAPAVKMAALSARARILEVAGTMLGASPGDLECVDGTIRVRNNPRQAVKFEEVCARLPVGGIQTTGEFNAELQQSGVAGAQFVEVEVDLWTGIVRPIKVVAVQDCGYALNRLLAESQVIGGVIQGLSMALLEERKMDDPTGKMLNADMEGYKVLGSLEVPEIEPILFDTHDRVTGIGEPPVIPTAAALGNAVFNATGVRVRTLPITPRRFLEAMEAQR